MMDVLKHCEAGVRPPPLCFLHDVVGLVLARCTCDPLTPCNPMPHSLLLPRCCTVRRQIDTETENT